MKAAEKGTTYRANFHVLGSSGKTFGFLIGIRLFPSGCRPEGKIIYQVVID